MVTGPAGKRGPEGWIDIQGSLTPGLGMMHHNEKVIGPMGQKTFVDGWMDE